LSKRLHSILIIAIALLIPSLVFSVSGNKVSVNQVLPDRDNVVVVPLTISNDVEIAALDIPLRYSEGVTLKEVSFTDTRVDYFDFKIAKIDDAEKTVVIGLIPQMSSEKKSDLVAGEGVIANLVFEINDPSIESISLEAVELKNPNHSLKFVTYTNPEELIGITSVFPEFSATTVALAGVGDNLPTSYALSQNYPNPFNPSTEVAFDMPTAGHVELVVYNVLGQEVTTLINGEMDAGSHVISFDGSSHSSGVYFYRISTGSFSETKKMVMLK